VEVDWEINRSGLTSFRRHSFRSWLRTEGHITGRRDALQANV